MARRAYGDQYIAGEIASPDAADFTPAADDVVEVLVDIAQPDWTPAADVQIAGQWGGAGQRSWRLLLKTTGALSLEVSTDGTATAATETSASNLSATAANGRVVVRAELDTATGDVIFESGATEAALAALGATQTGAGATLPAASTADLEFGNTGAQLFEGRLTIDSVVIAGPVAADVKRYQSSYRDDQSNLWRSAGSLVTTSKQYPTAAVGVEVPAAAQVEPIDPVPALPEMCTRINALDMTPVLGPVGTDPTP